MWLVAIQVEMGFGGALHVAPYLAALQVALAIEVEVFRVEVPELAAVLTVSLHKYIPRNGQGALSS